MRVLESQESVLRGKIIQQEDHLPIHRVFEQLLEENPDVLNEIALIDGSKEINFEQLNRDANCLARQILEQAFACNVQPNSDGDYLIAICSPPSYELIVTLLAIFKSGAAYVPLDPSFPPQRIVHIVNDAKPIMILSAGDTTNLENARLAFAAEIKVLELTSLFNSPENQDESNLPRSQTFKLESCETSRLAMALYTSGSTGSPKGVRLPHATILRRLQWQWREYPFQAHERCCFKTALTFVDSVAEIWGPLLQGVPVVVIPKHETQDPDILVSLLRRHRISRLVLVPSLLRSLLTYWSMQKQGDLPDLKLWVCSGETLPANLLRQFFQRFDQGHTLCNFYGSTEIMGDVTYIPYSCSEDVNSLVFEEKVPIGYAIDNCVIYLLDSDLKPVSLGQVGELYVAGGHVAAGYVNGREMARFMENPVETVRGLETVFKTGDYGRLVKAGNEEWVLMYEGRADSQVKVRGHRLDLTEVEARVREVNGVDKAVVLCYRPGDFEQKVVAFTTVLNGLTSNGIQEALKSSLPSYALPEVMTLSSIPLLVNGKIDRQELLKRFDQQVQACQNEDVEIPDVPENLRPQASALFRIIRQIVGFSSKTGLQLTDNFFNVGGNSLNSITVVTTLRDQGFAISIGDFLGASTLGEVLDKLQPVSLSNSVQSDASELGFEVEMLHPSMKDDIVKIIATSFVQRGDLEYWTKPTLENFTTFVSNAWEPILSRDLSFAVKQEGRIVAVSLNFDLFDEPEIDIPCEKMSWIFQMLEVIESPVRKTLETQSPGYLLHSFMMGVEVTLPPQENIKLIMFMEDENIRLAQRRNFKGLMTTNTNELTREYCDLVLGYIPRAEFQVNQYALDKGYKPFGKAPDSQKAVCTIKIF